MKKYSLIALFAMFFMSIVAQQQPPLNVTIDWESYDPPSTLKVKETFINKAKYPVIDIHSHHWNMDPDKLETLIGQLDTINVAVTVNLSGKNGLVLKEYMENIKNCSQPNRFVVFSNIELRSIDDPDWTESTVKQIEYDYKNGSRGLKIYKTQGMVDVDNAGNRIRIDDSRIGPVWDKCGELGMPVLIHAADPASFWEAHDSLNERWLELKVRPQRKREANDPAPWEQIIAEQHNVFRIHPKTTFINAHMGWMANDLESLGKHLDEFPNVYTEIGAVIAELGRQPRTARHFFIKYQDRVLFGKDYFMPVQFETYYRVLETDDEYFPYYKRYHAFWKMYGLDLPNEVLKKLYYKNALKILPDIDRSLFPE